MAAQQLFENQHNAEFDQIDSISLSHGRPQTKGRNAFGIAGPYVGFIDYLDGLG
jgi:hypothetical protein